MLPTSGPKSMYISKQYDLRRTCGDIRATLLYLLRNLLFEAWRLSMTA